MISGLPLLAHRILSALKRIAYGTPSMIIDAMFRNGSCQKCGQDVCDRCNWRNDFAIVGGLLPSGLSSRESAGVR